VTLLDRRVRDALPTPLVRSVPVVVGDIVEQHPPQVLLVQEEQMVEALTPHATQQPLASRIRTWQTAT